MVHGMSAARILPTNDKSTLLQAGVDVDSSLYMIQYVVAGAGVC